MTPEEFFPEAFPWALQAHAKTGVDTSVILAQWADETAFGGPDWSPRNNPGNVGDPAAGGQTVFPTLQAGVNAYVQTMLLGYYAAVRAARGWQAQAYALGESPWAGGHYEANGGPPGEDLVKIITQFNLIQYDDAPPIPAPPAPTQETEMIACTPSGNGYWICKPDGSIWSFGDAAYCGGSNPGASAPMPAGATAVGFASHPTLQGYWIEADFGGVYAFGAATYHGGLN